MRPWAAVLVLSLTACAEAHMLGDAGVDAPLPEAPPDAAPDAFCRDDDGDGYRNADCGGDDCDDADESVGSSMRSCTGATTIERCEAGVWALPDCPVDLPLCDTRTDECVALGEACGDRVLHEGEQCDADERCDDRCRVTCASPRHCPEEAPWCAAHEDPDTGLGGGTACVPSGPGSRELGEPCTSDEECRSTWCDPERGRCTQHCVYGDTDCAGVDGWCAGGSGGPEAPFAIGRPPRQICAFGCTSARECTTPDATVCSLVGFAPANVWYSVCARSLGPGADGAPCVSSSDCANNACLGRVCTRVCELDTDCPAGTECRTTTWVGPVVYPKGWRLPALVSASAALHREDHARCEVT